MTKRLSRRRKTLKRKNTLRRKNTLKRKTLKRKRIKKYTGGGDVIPGLSFTSNLKRWKGMYEKLKANYNELHASYNEMYRREREQYYKYTKAQEWITRTYGVDNLNNFLLTDEMKAQNIERWVNFMMRADGVVDTGLAMGAE